MSEEIPKFNETFLNILSVLSGGEVMEYRKMKERVKEEFYSDLPEDLLSQKTKSGGLLIDNRIGWGKSYLKEGGFVTYPQRAMVQITKKGVDAYKKGRLSLDDLTVIETGNKLTVDDRHSIAMENLRYKRGLG